MKSSKKMKLNNFSRSVIIVSLVLLMGFMVWLPYYAMVTTGSGG